MIYPSRTRARTCLTIIGIALVIGSGLGPVRSASGQESRSIVIDADECVDLASADARLACYDRRAEAARQARERAASPSAAADSSARAESDAVLEPAAAAGGDAGDSEVAAARQSRSRRGARGTSEDAADAELPASSSRADARSAENELRSAQDHVRSEGDADRDEIVATIADLRETIPDAYLITLENGQVWRQVQPKRYPLRPGDEVRIYVSRWGSYRLESDGPQTFIQVERVR